MAVGSHPILLDFHSMRTNISKLVDVGIGVAFYVKASETTPKSEYNFLDICGFYLFLWPG